MSISDKSAAKGLRLMQDAAEAYEDTMDDRASATMTTDSRARLGMVFAAYAIGVAIRDLGFRAAIVATVRAFKAGPAMVALINAED